MTDNKEQHKGKKGFIGLTDEDKNRIVSVAATIGVILVITALLVVTLWSMLDLVLLTFILTFLFYNLLNKTKEKLFADSDSRLPDGILLLLLYLIVVGLVALLSIFFIPNLILQITEIANLFLHFDVNAMIDSLYSGYPRVSELLREVDLNPYISGFGNLLMNSVTSIGVFGLHFLFAFLLSFMILLEKNKIYKFAESLRNSNIAFVYDYTIQFGGSFVNTFGTVMKVQVTISFINCILSMIMLTAMGFPSIIGLGIMIFLLGLIPVAGVIISLVPLCLIGFNVGGFKIVIAVIVMIVIIHAIEAYVLNPKLMSMRTSLPVCFVFIILLVSEHYLGVWGLLIGVPLFIFLMKSFNVDYQEPDRHNPIFKRFRKDKSGRGES